MKYVTVFFDVEAWWENPNRRDFNEKKALSNIKKVLDKYNVKAVFNVLGKVVEDNPEFIKTLDKERHEIASHGYAHENFVQLGVKELDKVLEKTENIIYQAIGKKPVGIRAPWILVNPDCYDLFNKRGYLWTSNRRRLHSEQVDNPTSSYNGVFDRFAAKSFIKIKSMSYRKEPFKIGSIFEIPLYSSMDGELLGLLDPNQESPEKWINYTRNSYITQFINSGKYFNLNFHDWLIGTKNRIEILDAVLAYISKQKNVKFILAKDLANLK